MGLCTGRICPYLVSIHACFPAAPRLQAESAAKRAAAPAAGSQESGSASQQQQHAALMRILSANPEPASPSGAEILRRLCEVLGTSGAAGDAGEDEDEP